MLSFGKFSTGLNTFKVKKSLLNLFCATRLHCKIVLCKSDFRFAGISILSDKITRIAG